MIREILMLGQKMYNTKNWRERHRLLTYRVRVLLYAGKLGALYRFFADNPARKAILETNPFPIEQATRAFFFAGSSCACETHSRARYAFRKEISSKRSDEARPI